jgi:bifunctional non-homologous end joining protein LigD
MGAQLTSPGKVIDPSTGLTKLDLARYYAAAARWMLPHLAGRHAYVKRAPEGLAGRVFFQQHPEGVSGFRATDPKLWPGHEPAFAFESAEDVLSAVQLGTIEIHTCNSTSVAIDRPDFFVLDLDPGEGVSWRQLQEAAMLVRGTLRQLGLDGWLKTTGGKGLHVVVPIQPDHDYPTVKGFSYALVQLLARTLPDRFVARSGPRNRIGRIFIDYLRNGQSQSTVAPLSARARPGMGVAMPVTWRELPKLERPDAWNIVTALQRLQGQKRDPWGPYLRTRFSLGGPIAALDSRPLR